MKCPYCTTENREDRESCYHCGKDISMLRVVINKARHHYNVALEHAERQRYPESLAELEHCLELDHSFVPAHVVTGTVYAKMGKFDEAERAWQAALSLDPHVAKAHEYIGKSALAKQAVPLLRRLRWAVGSAVAVTVVFTLLIVWRARPTGHRGDVVRITAAIETGDYRTALEIAHRLEDRAQSRDIRQAARIFAETVGQRYESAAIQMVTLLLDARPIEAHEFYQQLIQGRELPQPYQRQMESLDRKAADQTMALMDSWRRQMDDGTLSYEELVKKTERVSQVFAQRDEVARKRAALLASARQAWVAQTLNRLPASPLSTTDTLTWLARLRDMSARVPESREVLTSASKRLVAGAVGQLEPRMDKLLAGKDPAPVRSALATLQGLNTYGRTPAADRLIEKAQAGLRRLETDRFKARLAAATMADIPQLDAWILAWEKETSATIARDADASATLGRARRRMAAEVVTWCTDREMRFMRRKITNDEAKLVTDRAEFVLKYSGAKTWRNTRDCVAFCAAVGWLQLGNKTEAVRWCNRLLKDYPDSSYGSTARGLRKKIEDELKPPLPPAK